MKNPYAAVTLIAGNVTRCGYGFLSTSAEIVALRGSYPRGRLAKDVYAQVAAIHGISADLVARDVARAVEDIWEHGDRASLEMILKHKAVTKPTPGEVILALANYIAEGEKTIV